MRIIRIIKKEIAKLFSVKLMVVLFLFTTVFIWMFLSVAQSHWNYSNSPWDVDFYRELVSEFGPELTTDEWEAFLEKQQELINEFNMVVAENEILQKNGIDTYDKFTEVYADMDDSEDVSDDEKALFCEVDRLVFSDSVISPLLSKLQIMRNLDEDNMSLIHPAVAETVYSDFNRMIILMVVWCFIVILPYQISERLKGVRDIQLSTKTGRRIFGSQAVVCALTGLFSGLLLSAIYAFLLYRKGAFDFLGCVIISPTRITHWFDFNYGQYLLVYLAIFLLLSVAAALLAYFVGRLSVNYIAGIGISVPTTAVFCTAVSKLGNHLFYAQTTKAGSIVRMSLMFVLCAVCFAAVIVMLKRDKVRDVL
jgi:hypothetical protein